MYEVYTIISGDTLDSVARRYDTTIGVLERINGFNSNYVVLLGEQIVVPKMSQNPYQYYTVKKGDNMYEIAKDNDIDYNLLLQLNGLEKDDYIYPNQTIILPKKGLKLYMTIENDTLDDILKKSGASIMDLINENQKVYLRPEQIIVFRDK